jgi:hypothetical protein
MSIFDTHKPTGRLRVLLTPDSNRGYLKCTGGWPESPQYGLIQQEFISAYMAGTDPVWVDVEARAAS